MKSKLLNLKLNKNFKFHPFEKLRTRISNFRKGFTLIELLIVIVIIGVLATIFMSNFTGVRQRARDSQRKSNLRQIQAALELIRSDLGVYPGSLYTTTTCPTSSSLVAGSPPVTYMQKIPCDPAPPSGSIYFWNGNYYYSSTGSTYIIGACIENANDTDPNIILVAPSWCPVSLKFYFLQSQ